MSTERVDIIGMEHRDISRQLHMTRYHAAGQWAVGDVVDAACGFGNLIPFLHEECQYIGIDRSQLAIMGSMSKYGKRPNTVFAQIDLENYDKLPDCDTVVSLETLEHLSDPSILIENMKIRAWRIIISVPIIITTNRNKFHLTDFTKESLEDHFLDKFEIRHFFTQQGGVYGFWVFDLR